MTANNAALYGIHDRGVIAPGMRADINVIDLDNLRAAPAGVRERPPRRRGPSGAARHGYRATVVAGEVTRAHDADTGARPGSWCARRDP